MEPIYKRKVWGGVRGWCTKVVRISFGVGVWKAKRRDWEVVVIRVNLEVGNGARVLFWKDKWCGPMPLCVAFPSLLAIVALVKDVWSPDEGGGKWNPLFLRPFNDWELKEVNKFLLSKTEDSATKCGGQGDMGGGKKWAVLCEILI